MAINSLQGEVKVWVYPVDPEAAFRSPCAVNVAFSGLIAPDNGDTSFSDGATGNFSSLEWQGQQAIRQVAGPLQFVRLLANGTAQFGARAASGIDPRKEVCGFTVRPTLTRLHSTISEDEEDSNDLPRFPSGQPTIEWLVEQGDQWGRWMPAREPLHGALRHKKSPANFAVKVKTKEKWPENGAIGVVFDLDGVAYGHIGPPGLRFEWGGRYSIVCRGVNKDARPVIERRSADGEGKVNWKSWRTLEGAPPLDENFWRSRHEVFIYQMSGFLFVSWNGVTSWIGEVVSEKVRPITWKAAPLRLSQIGCDNELQISKASFDVQAQFASSVTVDAPPLAPTSFFVRGGNINSFSAGGSQAKSKLRGTDLGLSVIAGTWESTGGDGIVNYTTTLRGTETAPPLLCSFAVQFPPTAVNEGPEPVNLRHALESLEVESGQPETLPSAEARINVYVEGLEKFVPDWASAILPFRPVHIEVDEKNDGDFKTVFWGYLLPEGISSENWNGECLTLVARDATVRIREPAALVDGRFAPLDLMLEEVGGDLFGAQCVQKLLGLEDQMWAAEFNGNGNPFRFYEPDHYPLKSDHGEGYFTVAEVPNSASFDLPPPFGDDLERWLGKIEEFDHAVRFFDPFEGTRGAWVYGDITRFFSIRGATIYPLHASTEGLAGNSLANWPLLSSYSAQGLLEKAFTRVRVMGAPPQGGLEAFMPSLVVGAAGQAPNPFSLDPLSENQSWPRTLQSKQEFIGRTAYQDYADSLAWRIWSEFEGRAPERWEFVLKDQILLARWGEKVELDSGEELRIVRVKTMWNFNNNTRSTELTARSLSARGL